MTPASPMTVIGVAAILIGLSQPSAQEEREIISAAQNGCPAYFATVKPGLWHATKHNNDHWIVTSDKASRLSIEVVANEPPYVLCLRTPAKDLH